MREEVPHVWGRMDPQLRILRQGACPLLKCRVEKKTKVNGFIRHDTRVLSPTTVDTFENKVQHTTREYEG